MSEPPNSVIGSNVPSDLVLPKRVSTRPVVPPTAVPGPKWQGWHEASLKTGPSPSSTPPPTPNSSLPAGKRPPLPGGGFRERLPTAPVTPPEGGAQRIARLVGVCSAPTGLG